MSLDYFSLITGNEVELSGICYLRSPKISEISDSKKMGIKRYKLYIQFMSWDKAEYLKYINGVGAKAKSVSQKLENDAFNTFDVVTIAEDLRNTVKEIMSFFVVGHISWIDDKRYFLVSNDDYEGIIDRNNFDKVRTAILKCNYIRVGQEDEEEEKKQEPEQNLSDYQKDKWKYIEEMQAKLAEQNSNKSDENKYLELANVISKLSICTNSYNVLNIKDLTVFQVYDQYIQYELMRSTLFSESIFATHGGNYKFEEWQKPISDKI